MNDISQQILSTLILILKTSTHLSFEQQDYFLLRDIKITDRTRKKKLVFLDKL